VAAAVLSLVLALPCAADILPTAVPAPDGSTVATALAINDAGQCAGVAMALSDVDMQSLACLWQDGVLTVLPLLDTGEGAPVTYTESFAYDLNNHGVVVGLCSGQALPDASGIVSTRYHAVRWITDPATGVVRAEDLGMLEGEVESRAYAINGQGQILCQSAGATGTGPRYFLWEEGGVRTPIQDSGDAIDPQGVGMLYARPLLAPDGKVAGTVDIGYWTGSPAQWVNNYKVVL
jgi:uncharacterized membrane protein